MTSCWGIWNWMTKHLDQRFSIPADPYNLCLLQRVDFIGLVQDWGTVFLKAHSNMYPGLKTTDLKEQGWLYKIKCVYYWRSELALLCRSIPLWPLYSLEVIWWAFLSLTWKLCKCNSTVYIRDKKTRFVKLKNLIWILFLLNSRMHTYLRYFLHKELNSFPFKKLSHL